MLLAESYVDHLPHPKNFDPVDLIPDFETYARMRKVSAEQFQMAAAGNQMVSDMLRVSSDVMNMFARASGNPLLANYTRAQNTVQSSLARLYEANSTLLHHYGAKRLTTIPLSFEDFTIDGKLVQVEEQTVVQNPFGAMTYLSRSYEDGSDFTRKDPPVILFVPSSGHKKSLLQDIITNFARDQNVYIFEMADANHIPTSAGRFDYHDKIDFMVECITAATEHAQERGHQGRIHTINVCEPGPPTFIAAMLMAADNDERRPQSMHSLGSPYDTRINPTAVNDFANGKSLDYFINKIIQTVPSGFGYEGEGRHVHAHYVQRLAFIMKSLENHIKGAHKLHGDVMRGDDESVTTKQNFDDVFFWDVASTTAEFYLQAVQYNFLEHTLPNGAFEHRDQKITGAENTDIHMGAIEGEKDDVTGLGQTRAKLDFCKNLPADMKSTLIVPAAGHYGIFSGRKMRTISAPHIKEGIRRSDPDRKGYSPLARESQEHARPNASAPCLAA